MLRHIARLSRNTIAMQRAGYQNFVMSDALAQLERECERYCRVPRFPPQKVSDFNINFICIEPFCRVEANRKLIN